MRRIKARPNMLGLGLTFALGPFASLLTYLQHVRIRPISDPQFDVANLEIGMIQAPEPGLRTKRYELTDFERSAIRLFRKTGTHPHQVRGRLFSDHALSQVPSRARVELADGLSRPQDFD